jgi:hypothetical protein
MSGHVDLIFVGAEQFLPIVTASILWLGLAGIGGLLTARDRLVEANAIYGWAIISGVFTTIGVVFNQSLFALSCILAVLSLLGIYRSIRIGQPLFIKGMWRVFVMAFPLLWIAGAMEPSQWDEFSHWLPASKYLAEFNDFPNKVRPFFGSDMLPAYPYGWPYLMYLSSMIAGQFIDNVSSTLNIFLLLSFSALALRAAYQIIGNKINDSISWPFASAIVLLATIFNPTFVQKIVLTAYSDLSTSVLTGFSMLIGYYFSETLAKRRAGSSSSSAWQLSLVLSLLINVRQANLVLVVAVVVALSILVLRDNEISLRNYLKYITLSLLPIIAVYLAWRYHVALEFQNLPYAEVSFKRFSLWNITEIPEILKSMTYVAFKKIGFFGPMCVACYFGIKGLVRFESKFDRISILITFIFLFYTAFLFFAYIAAFNTTNAVTAVSFWRYSTHNGMLAVVFIAIGGIWAFRRRSILITTPRWLRSSVIFLVLILPLGLAHKIRFDLEPPKPHFIAVAKEIKVLLPKEALVFVLDPMGTGESWKITNYFLNKLGVGYIAAFNRPTIANVRSKLNSLENKNYVLIHSLTAGFSEYFDDSLRADKSYLFQKHRDSWLLIHDWRKPKNHNY